MTSPKTTHQQLKFHNTLN